VTVAGAGLSAADSAGGGAGGGTAAGVLLVVLSNIAFGARGVLTKRIKATYPQVDDYSLFFHVCALGVPVQMALGLACLDLPGLGGAGRLGGAGGATRRLLELEFPSAVPSAVPPPGLVPFGLSVWLINGVTFWLYLQVPFSLNPRRSS